MQALAERGRNPTVVNDQYGRLTFVSELAQAIRHLLDTHAPYGLYNVSGTGPVTSWADIARATFALTGHDPPNRVTGVSTETYFFSASAGPVAPRPHNSVLELTKKIHSTGYTPSSSADSLIKKYLQSSEPRSANPT